MKKTMIVFLMVFAGIMPAPAEDAVTGKDCMKIQMGNIGIDVPPGWFAQYTKYPQVFFLYSPPEENDTFKENCNLVTEFLPSEYSLDSYIDASLESIKTVYEGFTLEDREANHIIVSGLFNNIPLKQLQYYFIGGQTAYVLTFTSTPLDFKRYLGIFTEIAESFSFED